jgi:hypothetical protein
MKFQYLREPANPSGAHPTRHSTLRPRIPVRLRYGNRYIDLFALIDSGADECLFPVEVARALRIDLRQEKSHQYAGIGAGAVTAFFETVTIEVGGWPFSVYVGFSDSPSVVPILGQNGFFNLFDVRFNLSKEAIELRPVKNT